MMQDFSCYITCVVVTAKRKESRRANGRTRKEQPRCRCYPSGLLYCWHHQPVAFFIVTQRAMLESQHSGTGEPFAYRTLQLRESPSQCVGDARTYDCTLISFAQLVGRGFMPGLEQAMLSPGLRLFLLLGRLFLYLFSKFCVALSQSSFRIGSPESFLSWCLYR